MVSGLVFLFQPNRSLISCINIYSHLPFHSENMNSLRRQSLSTNRNSRLGRTDDAHERSTTSIDSPSPPPLSASSSIPHMSIDLGAPEETTNTEDDFVWRGQRGGEKERVGRVATTARAT